MIGEIRNSQMVDDYIEFSGEDINDVIIKIMHFREINKDEFININNHNSFYENSDNYIFDLLQNNLSKQKLINKINLFSPLLFSKVMNSDYKSFLEFGGGLGLFCEIIKELRPDLEVNHVDIKSKVFDFAKFRYNKRNIEVNQILIPQDDFEFNKKYDIIFTDAVIEHLPTEQQVYYINKLSSYVNDGGLFIPLIDLSGSEESMPMHNDVDINFLHNILEDNGLSCLYGRNTFSSIWKK